MALVLAQGACRSEGTSAPVADAGMPAVAAPTSLVAEFSLGSPQETWRSARLLGGTVAQLLPASLPVLLATSLSLPPAAAGSMDETLPLAGVLLSRKDAERPDVVVGMHVRSGSELVAALTLGDAAKFRQLELGPRIVRLLAAPGAAQFDGALGVSGNYLLLATDVTALTEAGRFVAEIVSKRAHDAPGLTLSATEGVLTRLLAKRLREAWQTWRAALAQRDRAERDAKGRSPDFADPAVVLAGADNTVEAWLGVIESSRELELSVRPAADRVRTELVLTPSADGAAALLLRELLTGPATPLLELPESTRLGLLIRGETERNADGVTGSGDSIAQLFGERLGAAQSKKLVEALERLARSRRGATAIGFVQTPAPALVATCELADGPAFLKGIGDVLSLVELPPVRAWLGATLGRPSLELTRSTHAVRHARLRFQAIGPQRSALPKSVSLTWEARDGVGYVVVSPEAVSGVSPFAEVRRLGSSAWMSGAPAALGDRTALSLFIDARLFVPGAEEPAPLWLSFGKKAERIATVLDVSAAALPPLAEVLASDSRL